MFVNIINHIVFNNIIIVYIIFNVNGLYFTYISFKNIYHKSKKSQQK
jgi:hypothetical protein